MRRDTTFLATACLLAAALAIGGAGMNFPVLEMVLDLVGLGVAAALIWRPRRQQLPALSRWTVAFVVAVVALPALQLVPLPPGIWHALAGREVAVQIDSALGINPWRPLTLDFEGTLRALLSLIPAFVLFLGCLHLHTTERGKLLVVIALFALVNAVLGIMQLASGGSLTPFPSAHLGYPIGLFVNRNHNAVFLLLAMPVIAALGAQRARGSSSRLAYIVATLAVLTILSVVIVGTTSRMALALLPISLAGSLLVLFFRESLWRIAIPSTLALGAIAATISWVGGLNRNLARFSSLHDARFDYWNDVYWALHHYGLVGTGFGTFVPIYETAESLSGVSPAILNHAHNDFIEVLLEGGVPAVVLLVLFFVLIGLAAFRLVKRRFELNRSLGSLAAAIGIVMVLIFSLVDYPLRMPAIACAFAVLCACLLPTPLQSSAPDEPEPRTDKESARKMSSPSYLARGAATLAISGLAFLVVEAGVSAADLLAGNAESARSLAPWSTAAQESVADDAFAAKKPRLAMDRAVAALKLSPIDAVALRTAAMAQTVAGSAAAGQRLMAIAVSLGWRDPMTQIWAIEASEQTKEPDKAIERAEALFQQDLFLPSSLVLLTEDAPAGPTADALVRTLASRPAWRANFLKAAAELPPAYFGKVNLIAARLNETRAPLSAEEAQPLVEHLLRMGQFDEARRLWSGTRRDGLIANGGFESVSSRNGVDVPSNWDISDEDLATIAIQEPEFPGHGRALRISAAARSGPILSQRLLLAPGSYSLTYRARSGPGPSVALRWQLSCTSSDVNEESKDAAASSSAWQQLGAEFIVPIRDCPIQTLALQRPNDIHSQEIWVDDVILRPTAR